MTFLCPSAYASHEQGISDIVSEETITHYGKLVARLEASSNLLVIHDSVKSFLLADASEPVKHVDSSVGGANTIAVIYPDIGEPYRAIFAKIIEGIEEKTGTPVRSYPIGVNVDVADLNAQLRRNATKVVIALGRQGVRTASGLDHDIAIVIGGVLSAPELANHGMMGISLTPDPALLFARLKSLMPDVKRVYVVYDPQQNEWLIKLAHEAAKAQGLELVAQEAHELASAAHIYENIFTAADSHRDAVWLPQDTTTVDEANILPLALKESWNRGVPIFSSSFLHVKKGALFALYPNNLELGRNLAGSALRVLSGDSHKQGIVPLREVQTAVNLRTASHIGLTIGNQLQRSFDSVFPEP